MNYHSVWVPGDLRWAVNPIQTGVIFASCDRGVASEAPSLKLRNRSWKKKNSNFLPKLAKWRYLLSLLRHVAQFISNKTSIHKGLEKLSENRMNGYSINLKWYKHKNKCYWSWRTVSCNVINYPKNNQLNWRRILNSFARP